MATMETKTLTWNELDERIGNMLEDMNYYSYHDLKDEGMLDEEIWSCDALTAVVEVLEENEFADNEEAEYLENQMLIKMLKEVR